MTHKSRTIAVSSQKIVLTPFITAAVLIGSVLLGAVARVADAATYEWTDPINGFFSTGGNWTLTSGAGTPPPKSGDTVVFNEAGAYTVSFSNTASSDAFSLTNGDVTFRSFGVDELYKIQSGTADATITGGTLSLGVSGDPLNIDIADDLTVNSGGTLNVFFGSDVQATDIIMGTSGTSTIIVDGSGSSLNRTGTTTSSWGSSGASGNLTYRNSSSGDINGLLRVGYSGVLTSAASIDVESDADLTVDSLEVGTFNTSPATGVVTVGGSGSTITQTGASTLTLGSASGNIGVLNVNSSGTFTTGTGGITVNATGQINLAGGTLNVNADMTLNGGTLDRTAGGYIVPPDWTLTASNNAQIQWMNAIFSINGGRTVIIESGADLFSNANLVIGSSTNGTDGTLIVDGPGSTASSTAATTWYWGAAGGTADATIRNKAQVNIAGTIRLADGGAGTTGIVNVESDGDLTIENFNVGSVSGGTATVMVTGSGSTLTNSSLTVGTSGSGSATIDLENGGVLNSGPSNTTVNKTGTINIGVVGSGTFNPFGDVVVNGGTINQGSGGAFNLVPGNAFTASNDAQINIDNSYSIHGGSNTTINSGADLSVASSVFISGNLGDGALIVDGDGSTLEAGLIGNDESYWGLSGNTANVTISNDATAEVGATFLAFGGHGNLHIESGGKISFDSLLIAGVGSPVNGSVSITGMDSSLTITGPNTLLVGNATDGTATIDVADQGTLSTSIGGMHLDGSGVVNLNEGIVNLNGPLTASFPGSGTGTFHFNSGQLNVNDQSQTVSIGPSSQRIGSFPLSTSAAMTLFANRGLHVAGMTQVELGGVFQLAGGSFSGGTLLLQPGGLFWSINTANSANVAILALAGSTIDATSDLTLGDATRVNGSGSAGTLRVRDNTVTLHDQNDAVFDSLALVTLGESGNAGTLIAANGLTLDFGGNIAGFGTIDTPNDAAKPLTNNGHIAGNSGAEPITLTGYVKGVGTMNNVVINGTDAPGFSPATVIRGSVEYDGTLQIELGGTSTGEFDQINHVLGDGIAELGGELDVALLNGFLPSLDDTFEIITAIGGVNGTFTTLADELPSLASGLEWEINYGENNVVLAVIAAGLPGDYNNDGVVNAADYVRWRDTDVTPEGFAEWRENFGAMSGSGASQASIPEPMSLALAIVGLLLLGGRTTGRRMFAIE